MAIRLNERPYAGKTFRPQPEIHIDNDSGLVIVATPWGSRSSARKVIERMTDYLALARSDSEATSPFEKLSCLSPLANQLRIATMLANDLIYREENSAEYRSGVELFAAMMDDNEMVYVQTGQPQVLISRHGHPLIPISCNTDLAFDMTTSGNRKQLPPLPAHLLGLDTTIAVNMNSVRTQDGDRFVLLSYSFLPETIFSLRESQISLEAMSRLLAKSNPDQAFWLGVLSIENHNSSDEVEPNDEGDAA